MKQNNDKRERDMTITATIVLPAYVSVKVKKGTSTEKIRELLLQQADNIFETSGIKPVIHDSSLPELID